MNSTEVINAIAAIDASKERLEEHSIADTIRNLRPKGDTTEPPFEWIAEVTAFDFFERPPNESDPNDLWFGAQFSGRTKDGALQEWPSIDNVDEKMLRYWTERAHTAKHPVLKARYAGLLWGLSPKATGKGAGIEIARIHIDAIVSMARDSAHEYDAQIFERLAYALETAIRINDRSRVELVRDTIIAFEAKISPERESGFVGQSYDLLYCNDKAMLTEKQSDEIIQTLEQHLEVVSNPGSGGEKFDPWAAEQFGQRLAVHFRRANKVDDIRRVLAKVERAFIHIADQAAPMLAQSWFKLVENLYRHFGLNTEAAALRKKILQVGPGASDQLVKHVQKFEVKAEEMDRFVNEVLEGDRDAAVRRFVMQFIPRRDQTEQELKNLSSKAPLMFLIKRSIMDAKGRPVASVGSLKEDIDGHVVMHTSQLLQYATIFLRRVIEEMVKRFGINTSVVLSWIDNSPLFEKTHRPILERALNAYFSGDAMVAVHLFVPQIENAIRELLYLTGGDPYRPNRQGGMDLRTLDDLLRDPSVVDTLSSDVAEYFRILYTDRRGVNLRNDLCHGMKTGDSLGIGVADRVFHTLVMLAQIRQK